MIRAIKLEWLKMKHYRVFWILLGMYLLSLVVIASFGGLFLEWLKNRGAVFNGIDPTIFPIYDFPDIWQNMTYLASFGIILLSFIIIISVNNDIVNNTLRQNIIDGISKREYLFSKLGLILLLGIISTIALIVLVLIHGWLYSSVLGTKFVFDEWEFVMAYFLQILMMGVLAFLLALLIKKSGFVIVALFLYAMMFEPMLVAIFTNVPELQDTILPQLANFLPVNAINNLIEPPFAKYIFKEIEDNISIQSIIISMVWLAIYLSGIIYLLKKKDLKA